MLGRVAHKYVRRWINLTGSPTPNSLLDLWGQMWFIDGGARLGRTYDAFKQRWFYPSFSGYGFDPFYIEPYGQFDVTCVCRFDRAIGCRSIRYGRLSFPSPSPLRRGVSTTRLNAGCTPSYCPSRLKCAIPLPH